MYLIFNFIDKRKKIFATILLVVLLCLSFGFFQLNFKQDFSQMLPDALSRELALFQNSALSNKVFVIVRGDNEQDSYEAAKIAVANLSNGLKTKGNFNTPTIDIDFMLAYYRYIPNLWDTNIQDDIEDYIQDVKSKIDANIAELFLPQGQFKQNIIIADPLNLLPILVQKLKILNAGENFDIHNGFITSKDLKTILLIFDYPKSFLNLLFAEQIRGEFERLKEILPKTVEIFYIGAPRVAVENFRIIMSDITKISVLSIVLMTAMFLIFLRSKKAIFIYLIPFASILFAAVITNAVFKNISGITMGFGAVVMGLAVDYSLYMFFALKNAKIGGNIEIAEKMVKPILASAWTSILMFLLLLFSGIEILKQVSVFCASGLVFASLSALFAAPFIFDNKQMPEIKFNFDWLPHFCRHCRLDCNHYGFDRRHCGLYSQTPSKNEAGQIRSGARGKRVKALIIVIIIFISAIASAPFVKINLDFESLNTNSKQLETDQKNFAALTGNAYAKNQLFFVFGKTIDEVLRNNEIISKQNNNALSMSFLFPSEETKENNKIRWKNFWQPRTTHITDSLNAVLKKYSLEPSLFKDFFAFIKNPNFENNSFDLTPIYNPIIEYNGEYAFVNIILIDAKLRTNKMVKTLSISNISIQEKAAKSVLTRFAVIIPAIFILSFAVLILIFKKIKLAFIAILAPLCSIGILFIIAAILQVEINLFGLFAIPLIVGLGIDYGIFMVFQSMGGKDLHPTKAVFLAALSTLIGFGSLMIAQHKVLFNIGFVVFVGIFSTILISIFVTPAFLKRR